jgi:hypothetical protein
MTAAIVLMKSDRMSCYYNNKNILINDNL